MRREPSGASPHRWLLPFLAITLLPSAALAWFGWQFVVQDRALQARRVQEILEGRAAAAGAAIERELTATERELPALLDPEYGLRGEHSAIVVRLGPGGVLAHSGLPLLYTPVHVSPSVEPPESTWTEAERFEFARRDPTTAAGMYRELSMVGDAHARAGALVRLARALRAAGRNAEALETYSAIAAMVTARVNDTPADLVARFARIELLGSLGRASVQREEAAALGTDLQDGRWPIDRVTYDAFTQHLAPWGGAASPTTLALTEMVANAWADWQSGILRRTASGRRAIKTAVGPALLVWRADGESLIAFAATVPYLSSMLERMVGNDADVALVDGDGRIVAGPMVGDNGARTYDVGMTETRLPWVVRVTASSLPPELDGAGRQRRQIVIAGLAVLAFLLSASAYLVSRAVRRELALARQQADFVSAVSHEFRSPLTALTHLTALLRGDAQPSEARRREYFEALGRETDRLRRFVDTLLAFGRIQAGAAIYRPAALDVCNLVGTVVEEFGHEPTNRSRRVSFSCEDVTCPIEGDAEGLERAIWNLLENAAKYSAETSPIEVQVAKEGRLVAIRVVDHGLGIPSEEQALVFRQFFRGSTAVASAIRGTGVGLAVVDNIVRAHAGRVRVKSAPGAGSTFSILLPVAQLEKDTA